MIRQQKDPALSTPERLREMRKRATVTTLEIVEHARTVSRGKAIPLHMLGTGARRTCNGI